MHFSSLKVFLKFPLKWLKKRLEKNLQLCFIQTQNVQQLLRLIKDKKKEIGAKSIWMSM